MRNKAEKGKIKRLLTFLLIVYKRVEKHMRANTSLARYISQNYETSCTYSCGSIKYGSYLV